MFFFKDFRIGWVKFASSSNEPHNGMQSKPQNLCKFNAHLILQMFFFLIRGYSN